MLNSHIEALISVLNYSPHFIVLAALSWWALSLQKDRRNKDEWAVRDAYLDFQILKRYPLARSNIKVNLDEIGEISRVERPETIRRRRRL